MSSLRPSPHCRPEAWGSGFVEGAVAEHGEQHVDPLAGQAEKRLGVGLPAGPASVVVGADGPVDKILDSLGATCSPHPREWSPSADAAPRTCGDGPGKRAPYLLTKYCSPHSRGWSPRRFHRDHSGVLLPATVGMVPTTPVSSPAAGAAPRTCGDGPLTARTSPVSASRSPHSRGWSHDVFPDLGQVALLLAPAGMVPRRRRCGSGKASAPRTRADDPGLGPAPAGTVPRDRTWAP